jgi:hypothetical protein
MGLLIANFYKKHLCRLKEWPDGLNRASKHVNGEIYSLMKGSSKFGISGSLAKWDIKNRLNLLLMNKEDEILHLYLKEINSIYKEYRESKLSSKGFFDKITVQDFPIRGHQGSKTKPEEECQNKITNNFEEFIIITMTNTLP